MKKNILIAMLVVVIIILINIILHPSVVTQRKTNELPPVQKTVALEQDNTNNEFLPAQSNNESVYTENQVSDMQEGYNNVYQTQSEKEINTEIIVENLPQFPVVTRRRNFGSSLSVCEPYKETMTTEYMGMNITYNLEILGWVNNKCVLNFETNMNGSGESFEDVYGITADSAQVFGFAPKVRCEFTKQQLLYVGDNILEEKDPANRKMLKDPNQIEFPDIKDLSFSDVKLLQIIFNDKACQLVNSDELNNLLEGLFMY